MYISWSDPDYDGSVTIIGMPLQGCFFCDNYDKQIGLIAEKDDIVYDVSDEEYINDYEYDLYVICGKCSSILDICCHKRDSKHYFLFSNLDEEDEKDESMFEITSSDLKPHWSNMKMDDLKIVMKTFYLTFPDSKPDNFDITYDELQLGDKQKIKEIFKLDHDKILILLSLLVSKDIANIVIIYLTSHLSKVFNKLFDKC